MSAPDQRCRAALERLLVSKAERVYPPSVLSARDVLELSGESIRNRLCAFQDNANGEFAMRPDMTTPIAMMLAAGSIGVGRHAYSGNVYRLPRTGRHDDVEFEQVGFEWFGADGPHADAEAFGEALAMLRATGVAATGVVVGDVGLFHAVVDGLAFSTDWADRLKRSFGRQRGPVALLEAAVRLADGAGSDRLGLRRGLLDLEPAEAERRVEAELDALEAPVFAGRSRVEIVERAVAQGKSSPPDASAITRLEAYLSIRCKAADAVEAVRVWADGSGVDLDTALAHMERRHDAIAALTADDWRMAEFDTALGRRFAYYDGFAFEFSVGGRGDAPVVSGGRYDGLITRIDPDQAVSAIGAALRADRLPEVEGGR